MKESYYKAVPDGKFIILIPCTTCGSLNNIRGDFTLRQNAAMWQLRKISLIHLMVGKVKDTMSLT